MFQNSSMKRSSFPFGCTLQGKKSFFLVSANILYYKGYRPVIL